MMSVFLPVIIFAGAFFSFGVWVGRAVQQSADERAVKDIAELKFERDSQGVICAIYDNVMQRYVQ